MPTESRLVSRRAGSWLPAIAAFLVLVVAVGGWLVIADDGERLSYAPNEVYMVSAASAGAVFTPSLVAGLVGVDGGAPATTLATAPGMEVIPVKGSEELNYSGERGTVACDPSLLMEYLSVESSVAEVWAGAQGIDVGDVGRFVGSLTPMLLSQDVRVTEFVLAGDIAIPRQALLQYGTAVLVSSVGDPRVRCFSGNPLSVPAPVDAPIYIGTAWSGFSSSNVVEIEPCDEPLNQFVLLDLATGDAFVRSIGAAGGDDSDVVLSAPGTSTTTTLMSTTTSTALTTTSTSTTTTLPVADHNATVEGTVSASSQLCGSYAPAKAVDGDVTTSWISSSGDGGTSVFRWASPQDDFIGGITIVSNAANAKRATDHGFEAVTVSILDSAANVVFEERVDLPGTPDPDVVLHPNVVGQLIVLLLEGHENPKGSGFAELTVMVAR
ncbi:MAG: discoidin domain-containing protein [Acidimicrobiia bacterium]|nr:discoidin domain-containing protein [Acidimicrobiia bacterium]